MNRSRLFISIVASFAAGLAAAPVASACTNILVTKGATKDGSVIITYTCDGEFHPTLRITPAADHKPGDVYEVKSWGSKVYGAIPQPAHTYAVVGLINEHQLAISETTYGGREELYNPDGLLHYWDLMQLALQRAKTAREAIKVMTDLVDEYGYRSPGESISIADTNEAWILEIIGKGPGRKGAAWVALRVPDGYVSCHANKARISTFPREDTENCLYSGDVIEFAIEKGYYDPKSGEPFSYCEAFCPTTPTNNRYADTRVWSILRRTAPSLNLSSDYHRAVEGAKPYPLWVKPDEKLGMADVMALMRDHYEGTDFDMTKGIDAGPYGSPLRTRPMGWTSGGVEHTWERPISTQQTGFSFISQSRGHLPDPVGGVYWYGVDDTAMTCWVPFYCSADALPRSYTVGGMSQFTWDSIFWNFNFVSNFAHLKYSHMIKDIQAVQGELEGKFLALQPAVEKTAVELLKTDPGLARRYLTDYSVSQGDLVARRWRELGETLIRKYNDGYIQHKPGDPSEGGYPQEWLDTVKRNRPGQFVIPEKKHDKPESKLVD